MNGYFMVCLFFSQTILTPVRRGLLSYTNGARVEKKVGARVEKKVGEREQLLKYPICIVDY